MLSFCPLAGEKKKALSGFLFLLSVTLFSGPCHAGDGQHCRHGVDTDAGVEGLGRTLGGIGLGVGGGVVVVVGRLLGSGVGYHLFYDGITVGIDQQILALRGDLLQRRRGGVAAEGQLVLCRCLCRGSLDGLIVAHDARQK